MSDQKIFPHPGLWLTTGDWSKYRLMNLVIAFDCAVIGPLMCRLDKHRWITTSPGEPRQSTRCWYCGTPRPENA